ncbi:phage tail protein [Glutamicibacter sp. MNS18]|uniref:phage tail protein n=1 Tax=Glutamicibacter sp. MNS18 TaxID=2989817 RepID=UPI002235BCAE|nr:phage tail protein [Glutamicibacter sp. MNS18]MCW4464556.1 phage tail protein [Glutamicibacter sp. MNS18]
MSSPVRRTTLPYLRLGGSSGWKPLLGSTALQLRGEGVTLGYPGARRIPLSEERGSFGGATLVRGTAISPTGELLVADLARRTIGIHRQPVPGAEPPEADFTDLWPARPLPVEPGAGLDEPTHPPTDPYTLLEPLDLAFTPGGDLVIADAAAGRLLVLAWPRAAVRAVITLPGWRPVALAVDAAGACHVADARHHTVHRFDSRWRHDPGFPHPDTVLGDPWQLAAVAPACAPPATCTDCGCQAGSHPARPVLAVLDGKRMVLLDSRGRMLPGHTPLPPLVPPALQRDATGALSWPDPAWPGHQPLRFGQLVVDRTGRHTGTGLALLAVARTMRLPQAGRLRLGPLAGQAPGFAWDRLVLDARIPQGTEILVSTLSSDSPLEPESLDEAGASWSQPMALGSGQPTELLVHSRPGANLWIEIELRGTGSLTPTLRRLDVHAPRHSSLAMLPPGYRQEPDSADFLDRFLSYFDTVFAEVEATHRNVAELLDARSAPAGAALDWLGSWFGLDFDVTWDEPTRRRVIGEAMAYRTERGTVPGIRRLLRWHTALPEPWPAVIEHFRVPAEAVPPVGGSALEDPGAPHQCTIVLPACAAPAETDRQRIRGLLAAHLPAHVRARVRYIHPGVVIGAQSSVGVDTLLGGVPDGNLGTGQLGIDAATAPGEQHGFLPARSTSC